MRSSILRQLYYITLAAGALISIPLHPQDYGVGVGAAFVNVVLAILLSVDGVKVPPMPGPRLRLECASGGCLLVGVAAMADAASQADMRMAYVAHLALLVAAVTGYIAGRQTPPDGEAEPLV